MWVRNKEQWADRRVMTANTRVRGPRRVSIRVASGGRYLVTSGKRVSGTGRAFPARREASLPHASEPVVSLIPWRPRRSGEAVCPYGSTTAVKGAAVSKQGSLLGAPTDWRLLCRPISSIPAVRQLSAGKGVGRSAPSSGSPQGAEGGRWKTSTATAACIERARRAGEGAASRVVRSGAHGKRPTRGGRKCENALELRGRASAEFPGQAMHGAL